MSFCDHHDYFVIKDEEGRYLQRPTQAQYITNFIENLGDAWFFTSNEDARRIQSSLTIKSFINYAHINFTERK